MRVAMVILALVLTLGCYAYVRNTPNFVRSALPSSSTHGAETPTSQAIPTTASAAAPAKIDFATQIRPILDPKCQPCHFNGGTMYQRLPFDRPETIRALGTKLFTRIQDENQRRLIRDFLAQE